MRKAYIGPLGDDFPALLPIMLGLMLFFSSIALAYMVHDAKSSKVNMLRANIMISRAVREQVHFTRSYWEEEACSKMQNTMVNYGVKAAMRITMSNYTIYSTTDPTATSIQVAVSTTDSSVKLSNSTGSTTAVCPLTIDWANDVPPEGLTMTYPVMIDSTVDQLLPASLTVVTWR